MEVFFYEEEDPSAEDGEDDPGRGDDVHDTGPCRDAGACIAVPGVEGCTGSKHLAAAGWQKAKGLLR